MIGKDNRWFFSEVNPELRKQFMECKMPKLDFASFEKNILGEWRTEKDEQMLRTDRAHKESVLTRMHQQLHTDAELVASLDHRIRAELDAMGCESNRFVSRIEIDEMGRASMSFPRLCEDDEKDPGTLASIEDAARGHGGCPDDIDECMAVLYGFK